MKNKKIIIFLLLILIICFILGISICINNNKNKNDNIIDNTEEYIESNIDKNEVSYNENSTIDDLKEATGITGDSNIYEVEKEYDGRKVLTVKASLKYKVGFAGMIKNAKPEINELDEILNKNLPQYNGIWIESNSRNEILGYFNNSENTDSKYYIDNEGYLKVSEKNNQSIYDKKIEKIINGNKQYILDISSICYIVDDVTGEILDYNFENIDKYQTYKYFEDEDKFIIFINENTHSQLDNSEIFNSIIELF